LSQTYRHIRQKLVRFLRFVVGPSLRFLIRLFQIELLPSKFEDRVGHQITEPLYLELLKRAGETRWKRVLVLWDPAKVSNRLAFDALPQSFIKVNNRLLRKVLNLVSYLVYSEKHKSPTEGIGAIGVAADIFRHTHLINPHFEFLKISDEAERIRKIRLRLGIPIESWICTLHVREQGFFDDETSHAYRNSSPEKLNLAIGEVTSEGGFVIRVGQNQRSKIEPKQNYIELNSQDSSSSGDDLLLARSSRFFLGNSSGALAMAASHGVPVVAVNVAPLGAVKVWGDRDLAIPKLYRCVDSGRLASFSEILHTGVGDLRDGRQVTASGFDLMENSAVEIREVVREMIDKLSGSHIQSEQDAILQARFQSLFSTANYTFYSKTLIGAEFLRRYADLLR